MRGTSGYKRRDFVETLSHWPVLSDAEVHVDCVNGVTSYCCFSLTWQQLQQRYKQSTDNKKRHKMAVLFALPPYSHVLPHSLKLSLPSTFSLSLPHTLSLSLWLHLSPCLPPSHFFPSTSNCAAFSLLFCSHRDKDLGIFHSEPKANHRVKKNTLKKLPKNASLWQACRRGRTLILTLQFN